MFGKDQKENTPQVPDAAGPEKVSRNSGVGTFFGAGTKYTGKFEAEGSVQIDGRFDGEVHVRGTLMVGKDGAVNAKVFAQSVVVHGRLEGEVEASGKMELKGGSTFQGDVRSPSFVIQEKAQFEGTCHMKKKG